jgi:hypothetical protein
MQGIEGAPVVHDVGRQHGRAGKEAHAIKR